MKRDLLLDYLKLLAILVVVMIHLPDTGHIRSIIFPLNANAVFATLAGMFMLSGGTLRDWLRKRWHRLVIPYLVWETIYAVIGIGFDVVMHKFEMPCGSTLFSWVFWGGASVQLWFVATLFYVQLILWCVALGGRRFLPKYGFEVLLLLIAIGSIAGYAHVAWEGPRHLLFVGGYCALGALLRLPYEKFIGDRFCSSRWGGVCKYTMGIYLCHFLFTRVVSMIYPHLLGFMPQVLAVVVETTLAFGASLLLVHITHKRFYWLWGMKKQA